MHNKFDGQRVLPFLLLAVLFAAFFHNLGSVPLFDLDEGAFSEATREMLARGDFISTYLNGEPRYDKPILIYWLQAASVTLLGLNEFALRLPSALFSVLWVGLIYGFVSRVKGRPTALLAALITAGTLQVSLIGKAAIADAALNFFLTGALFSIYLFYVSRAQRYIYLAFACAALGFLTKGPVAILLPVAVSFIFFLLKGQPRLWLKTVFNPYGIALFLLIAAPWYVAQYIKEGQPFIEGFFLKHNLARYQSSFEQHGGGLFYFIPVLLLGLLPFTAVFLKVLVHLKEIFKDELRLFLFIWFLFVFVLFSLSQTKLPHYIVYGYAPLFILMSFYITALRSRLLALLPQLLLFLALLALPLLTPYTDRIADAYARAALHDADRYFSLAYQGFFALAALLTGYFMLERRFSIAHKLVFSGFITVFGISHFVLPLAGELLQQPIKEAALITKRADYKVVMWGLNTPSFNVYSERLVEKRTPQRGDIVLTKSPRLSELWSFEVLYQKNGIALVKVTK